MLFVSVWARGQYYAPLLWYSHLFRGGAPSSLAGRLTKTTDTSSSSVTASPPRPSSCSVACGRDISICLSPCRSSTVGGWFRCTNLEPVSQQEERTWRRKQGVLDNRPKLYASDCCFQRRYVLQQSNWSFEIPTACHEDGGCVM